MPLKLVVIGCSAGGLSALIELLGQLPEDYRHPIVIAFHSAPESRLLEVLECRKDIHLPIKPATDAMPLEGPAAYVLPGATHGMISQSQLFLSPIVRKSGFRPSIDALFMTAAGAYRENTIAVVLSGTMNDGMRGAQVIHDLGGVTIVQDPDDADRAGMPQAVIAADHPKAVLPAGDLGRWLAVID
ncbi:MAG: chemotaxis protein CheB [Pseudomonadota bacterium]